ncbi:MAG: hypothetical protein LZF85_01480 [Nitrosomonas sp.]|uniref:hypothetical protein n=1 Tax=Nitrosomonas sp. TaxID=42353 RepID=UPI0025D069BB|nr:hypothetical protein [Nitrosomonas sp.]UJP03160.1 MAG: hypothetical protein LZF85_01480 [Nitrosomonas sp.]
MSHINPDDTLMLLIDHQSGLFQLVKDLPVPELRRTMPSRLPKSPHCSRCQ